MMFYADSKLLHIVTVGINFTIEKQLLIDPTVFVEVYEFCVVSDVVWIPFEENLENAMTKLFALPALCRLMTDNKLPFPAKTWFEKTLKEGKIK